MDHSGAITVGADGLALQYNGLRVDTQLGWMAPCIEAAGVYSEDSWVYASVSGAVGTVTVDSDGRERYPVGAKVRFKQGGSYKYFTIIAVNDTTIDITAGSDYTLTNSAITDLYVAIIEHPLDWPWKVASKPSWGLTRTTGKSVPHSTVTTVDFDAERWDTHGFHSTVSNKTRITIPTGLGGRYLIILFAGWPASSTGLRRVMVTKNGSGSLHDNIDDVRDGEVGGYGVHNYSFSTIARLDAGDYFEMKVAQTSGQARTLTPRWFGYKLD